jgi:cobalt/nickel transport protein
MSSPPPDRRLLPFLLAGMLVALLLAGVASQYASRDPDGLTKVAQDQGFAKAEDESATADSPLAGYGTSGIESSRLSGGLAGVAGVAATFLLAGGLLWVVRRRPEQDGPGSSTPQSGREALAAGGKPNSGSE